MKKVYRVYCNNCASTRATGWTKDVPTVCPYCFSDNIDTNSIVIIDKESRTEDEIQILCGSASSATSQVTGTTWTTIRKVVFIGTDGLGTPNKVKFSASAQGGTGLVRLQDLTNNVTIAGESSVTDNDVYVDYNTDNWPAEQAVLAVQVKTNSEQGMISIGEVVIGWSAI